MTWKERRTITVLSIILAILSAALLIVLGMKYRESRDAGETPDPTSPITVDAAGSTYTSLTYDNGSTTLSFSLNTEGAWVWSDDPDFPLDSTTVTAMLDVLSGLTPQQVLSDPDTPESYSLDDPAATLTAATEDQRTLTLDFGKATTDGDSYYAMMNGDSGTIYIFADTLYNLMQTPIYGMMALPELPELTGTNLLSISIQGAAAEDGEPGTVTTLTTQRPEGEEEAEATWRSGGANVTDSPTVQALLEDLGNLTIAKCVDYRPSDEAASICGFDAPAAQVSVFYRSGGVDQMLCLAIGNPLPDGSGRYTRIGDDTTIYLLSTSLLDPLMRVSVSGLEG